MSVFIDVIIVLVFLFPIFKYWHKGLIQAILGVGKFIAAVISAIILGRPVAMMINEALALEWISAIFAYSSVFLIAFLVLSILCISLKKIKIPIISGIDKFFGFCLGLGLGILSASMVATVGHSILEFVSAISVNNDVMNYYYDSSVFKFVNEIRIFSFIRSLI